MVKSRWPIPPPKDKVADNHIKVELDFIPVEERLPEDIGNVLGKMENGFVAVVWYTGQVWRRFWDDVDVGITHWAEIPEITQQNTQKHA